MTKAKFIQILWKLTRIGAVVYAGVILLLYFRQRSLLFHPSRSPHPPGSPLALWKDGDRVIGTQRLVQNPENIWLMFHGNAGQASSRDYVIPLVPERDAFYILEYPGYGLRSGSPSKESINQAAVDAYTILRKQHPNKRVGIIGESLGSGPACALISQPTPPDKIVLAVPFDILSAVASQHFPIAPIRLIMKDQWNNVELASRYQGPVDIFGAPDDIVIPISHAKNLANHFRNSHLIELPGGHNDWSSASEVRIRF